MLLTSLHLLLLHFNLLFLQLADPVLQCLHLKMGCFHRQNGHCFTYVYQDLSIKPTYDCIVDDSASLAIVYSTNVASNAFFSVYFFFAMCVCKCASVCVCVFQYIISCEYLYLLMYGNTIQLFLLVSVYAFQTYSLFKL